MKKINWVFWIHFEKRDWFSKFWFSRGANFINIQIFKLYISIGLPWHKSVVKVFSIEQMNKTNESCMNAKYSIKMPKIKYYETNLGV